MLWEVEYDPIIVVRGRDYYYIHRELFSVAGLTSASATLVEQYDYDTYGDPSLFNGSGTPISATAYNIPYLFTGQPLDVIDSGNLLLYYGRGREYDPVHGRWLQRDPAVAGDRIRWGKRGLQMITGGSRGDVYVDGMNLYEYARSNPLEYVDYSGFATYKIGTETPPHPYAHDMEESKKLYGSWSTVGKKAYIDDVRDRTWRTFTGGQFLYKLAADHLRHFYNNTGTPRTIDIQKLISSDVGGRKAFTDYVESAMRYVESEKPFGKQIVSYDDYRVVATSDTWNTAVGAFYFNAKATDIKCKNSIYEMVWTIFFRDFYDWDINQPPGVGAGFVDDYEMAEMHRYGVMRDYRIDGLLKYRIKWKLGSEYWFYGMHVYSKVIQKTDFGP
ncbi:MAG: hypothetical protein HJJLKODD_00969 [Phycisphaerae bacterium]|nr:hypothetical protein [Phycisphaerae bacterium]